MWNPFKRKPKKILSTSPLDEEYTQLRRAIERCDGLKFAVDAGQMSIADVVEKLRQNNFPETVVRKAIAESFGESAAEQHVK